MIARGGKGISQIESVGGKTLEEAYYYQLGFVYTYKEQYGEQTHVFTKGETEVELFADAKAFYCMVKTKEFPLTEISKSPLATPLWKKEYKAAPPEKRLLLIRDLLEDGLVALQDL